jgi:histidyl-tRNA synthetase
MEYANKRGVPFVAIIGETELQQNKISIKNMQSGNQQLVAEEELYNV